MNRNSPATTRIAPGSIALGSPRPSPELDICITSDEFTHGAVHQLLAALVHLLLRPVTRLLVACFHQHRTKTRLTRWTLRNKACGIEYLKHIQGSAMFSAGNVFSLDKGWV